MISESIVSLIPITFKYVHNLWVRFGSRHGVHRSPLNNVTPGDNYAGRSNDASQDLDEEPETEPPHRLVPSNWVSMGLAVSSIMGLFFVWLIFGNEGIQPWATAMALIMASVLALLGVRALGETDLNPVSGIGKISQLFFAVLQPGNVVANIIAGGVAEVRADQVMSIS